ncbi:MAG: polyphenol oxidase family protein [Termitinemataceae bacterium]
MHIYPFALTQSLSCGDFFFFPFIANGQPLSGVSCVLSSRVAGDMKYTSGTVNPNRQRFFSTLSMAAGRALNNVYACEQIHSRDVVLVEADRSWESPQADGLATADPSLWLSVTVADCMPIFLRNREGTHMAILHSGWKGTGILSRAIELFANRWQIEARELCVVLGPCIQSCCYEVDEERARIFEAEFGWRGTGPDILPPVVRREFTGKDPSESMGTTSVRFYLDLMAANLRLLQDAAVEHVAVCTDCTVMNPNLGSFRRESRETSEQAPCKTRLPETTAGVQSAAFTRMVALIGQVQLS